MNQLQEKNRINWIDITRGIGIFLVVLGHTYRNNWLLVWITSFHMPLFFILSGWLRGCNRKAEKWTSFVHRKTQAFLVPLFIFGVLTYVYWIVVESRFRAYDLGPMWFLIALFVAEIISELVVNFTGICGVIVTIAISGGGLYICSLGMEATTIFAWIPRCLGATLFYLIGVLISKYKEVGGMISGKIKFVVPILMIVSIVLSQINGRVDLYFLVFQNYGLYLLTGVIGSVCIYGLAQAIEKNRGLEYIGEYSIIILCTHEQIKRVIIYVLSMISHVSGEQLRNNIIMGLVIAVVVLLIELVVIWIVKHIATALKNTKLKWMVAFVK